MRIVISKREFEGGFFSVLSEGSSLSEGVEEGLKVRIVISKCEFEGLEGFEEVFSVFSEESSLSERVDGGLKVKSVVWTGKKAS